MVRSYRLCFELERRIHKIDRWRIPVPYGVPLRGIAYALAALAALLALDGLPLAGELLGALHPAIRVVVLPVAAGYALYRLRVDGRPAHAAMLAWLRFRLEPARRVGCRRAEPLALARLADVSLAPDERSAHYRPARVKGPTELLLRYPVEARQRGRTLELRQRPGGPMWRGKRVGVRPGERVVVR